MIDGDTIRVAGGRSVRLIGIDTPETKDPRQPVQCFGQEASARTVSLVPPGTPIRLVYDVQRTDRYRRTLAYVYRLSDGLFVNAALVQEGFARVATFPPNVAHVEQFVALQREAREANRGLWGACPAAEPTTTTTGPRTTTMAPPRTTTTSAPRPARACHPSYQGTCIPPDVEDADCAGGKGDGPYYVQEKNFQVVGPDEYGLDADKDGIGCEDPSS